MKLTKDDCRLAEAIERPYKLADGGGLYLLVKPNGSKHWRLKYRFMGKEKLLALGPYPIISLADARERRSDAKRLLVDGKDPMAQKQDAQRTAVRNAQNTFKAVALEWHERQLDRWSENHALNVMRRFDIDIFPYIGSRPIADIDAPELLEVLRRIEKRGSLDVAARVKQICGQVFRYGIATGRCKRDHSVDLRGALKTAKTQHYPALDIKEMPEFLKALERNEPRLFSRTRKGIRLLMLTFVRTSELIKATWDEFDLENRQWVIPPERMKTGGSHIVPLSRQAVEILKELKEENGHLNVKWILPGQVALKRGSRHWRDTSPKSRGGMSMHAANNIQNFEEAMRFQGLACKEPIIADGKVHRFYVAGDKPGKHNGWYVFYGEVGVYGSWKTGEKFTWFSKGARMSDQIREHLKVQLDKARSDYKVDRHKEHVSVAELSQEKWFSASPANPQHPYLATKQVKAHSLRQIKNHLLLRNIGLLPHTNFWRDWPAYLVTIKMASRMQGRS